MSRPKFSKLNELLKKWPSGVVATMHWFAKYGIYKQLVKKYCDSGWINKVGQGAYTKIGDSVHWQGGLHALQEELQIPVHIGGTTALEFSGFSHFIPAASKRQIFLFYSNSYKKKLPLWFANYFVQEVDFISVQHQLFNMDNGIGIQKKEWSGIILNISEPERAILEVLELVPQQESYSHANYLMQGLQMLRPALIQKLMEKCTSIKVKRLFMHLAEKNNLPCLEHIDLSLINFGKGKRMIEKGGVFDSKYNLSVPKIINEEFNEDESGDV